MDFFLCFIFSNIWRNSGRLSFPSPSQSSCGHNIHIFKGSVLGTCCPTFLIYPCQFDDPMHNPKLSILLRYLKLTAGIWFGLVACSLQLRTHCALAIFLCALFHLAHVPRAQKISVRACWNLYGRKIWYWRFHQIRILIQNNFRIRIRGQGELSWKNLMSKISCSSSFY